MTQLTLGQAIALSEAGRNDEAVEIVRQLGASGDPEALHMLAEMTWRGGMVDQDPPRGRLLYEYAAGRGHPGAGLIATNLLASGIAGKRGWVAALARLETEAKAHPVRRRAFELIRRMRLDDQGDPLSVPGATLLSERPYARLFPKLLTTEECAYLIDVASPNYAPSTIYDSNRQMVRDPIRTSDGSTLHWAIEDPLINALNRRVAVITDTQYEQGEALQSLRYSPGQEYRPHMDFVSGAANRRLWTALIYLNDDYDGGETAFVHTGLKVRGTTGDVLVFGNAGDDGGPEPLSEHAGLPVTRGIKYLATRWIREERWIP